MTILDQIAQKVRKRLDEEKARLPLETLRKRAARKPHRFADAFSGGGIHVIAEVKFASPSEGDIASLANPVHVAESYLRNGAAALSVLTERDHFKGSAEYLTRIRMAHPEARILMKDFIVDEYQVHRALYDGADAILLIVALLGVRRMQELHDLARRLGLSTLVEVHDEGDFKSALDAGARLIGVNNRDLRTLEVSLKVSESLVKHAPQDATLISESGLSSGRDLRRLRNMGYDGFLIGTHFMKSPDPGAALRKMLEESQR